MDEVDRFGIDGVIAEARRVVGHGQPIFPLMLTLLTWLICPVPVLLRSAA
jgi:hypothetical protein